MSWLIVYRPKVDQSKVAPKMAHIAMIRNQLLPPPVSSLVMTNAGASWCCPNNGPKARTGDTEKCLRRSFPDHYHLTGGGSAPTKLKQNVTHMQNVVGDWGNYPNMVPKSYTAQRIRGIR